MKIITVGDRDVDFSPESSLLLPGRPMFLPELQPGQRALLQPCVAVRINRLGKSVSPRFASRYHDAVAIALRLILDPDPTPGLTSGMDTSVYVGDWLPTLPQTITTPNGTPIPADPIVNNNVSIDTTSLTSERIAEAIAEVSRRTTIKMGDILLFSLPCPPLLPPPSKTHLTLTSETTPLLDVKVV